MQACVKATIVAFAFIGKIFNIISVAKGLCFLLLYIICDCSIRAFCPCCENADSCVLYIMSLWRVLNHMFMLCF